VPAQVSRQQKQHQLARFYLAVSHQTSNSENSNDAHLLRRHSSHHPRLLRRRRRRAQPTRRPHSQPNLLLALADTQRPIGMHQVLLRRQELTARRPHVPIEGDLFGIDELA